MSLAIPVAVRVGSRHVTRDVTGLTFRRDAVGGLKYLAFTLNRPLSKFDPDLVPFATCTLYDTRSAAPLGVGRLADPGRGSGTAGETWDVTAFGHSIRTTDITLPYVLVDSSLERWVRSSSSTKNATTNTDELSDGTPVLQIQAEEGKTVSTSWIGEYTYRGLVDSGQLLGRLKAERDDGVSDANYQRQLMAGATALAGANSSTTNAVHSIAVTTDFASGPQQAGIRFRRVTSATTGAETHWDQAYNVVVRAVTKNSVGTDITTGYTTDYVLANQVVIDLLGRFLLSFNGAAIVDATGTYQIDQMAYPDGVTAETVLNDLMALEPAFRWYVDNEGLFRWEPWPTAVRYEADLRAGGSFPASTQELYNKVTVRYRKPDGQTATVTRTLACTILDNAGITRQAFMDLADEIGSAAAAARAGDTFLLDHNVPANAGTVTIGAPIRDLSTGRLVDPFEIQAGELIRLRGVESYPDALNASSNDGLTVFRIWSMTYSSESSSAALELDSPSRTEINALVALAKRRDRKR